jgi:hypothetical protein
MRDHRLRHRVAYCLSIELPSLALRDITTSSKKRVYCVRVPTRSLCDELCSLSVTSLALSLRRERCGRLWRPPLPSDNDTKSLFLTVVTLGVSASERRRRRVSSRGRNEVSPRTGRAHDANTGGMADDSDTPTLNTQTKS